MLSFKAECCYFAVKKRYSSYGLGCESKPLVKDKNIGSGTQWQVHCFPLSGLDSRFLLWNKVILSSIAERVNEMKSQKWGLCPRLLWMKLFSWNGVQRNVRECAEWILNLILNYKLCTIKNSSLRYWSKPFKLNHYNNINSVILF